MVKWTWEFPLTTGSTFPPWSDTLSLVPGWRGKGEHSAPVAAGDTSLLPVPAAGGHGAMLESVSKSRSGFRKQAKKSTILTPDVDVGGFNLHHGRQN